MSDQTDLELRISCRKKVKRVPAEESRKRKETSHTADVYGESAEEKTQCEENFTKNIAQKNKKTREGWCHEIT
jgi:hypothetical protein